MAVRRKRKGKVQIPARGEEEVQLPGHTESNQLKSSFSKKDQGILSGQQIDHGPKKQSYCKGSQQQCGLN